MEFGWDIPNVHHGFGLDSYAVGDRYSEGVAVNIDTFRYAVERAERIGFGAIWVADHVLFPDKSAASHPLGYRANTGRADDNAGEGNNVRSGDPTFEAITTMSFLAGRTSKVRIGVGVLVIPYRNPVLTAKMLATLDVLSEGRIILAAGVGWLKEAFEALGADYAHRGAVTDEYLDIMKVIWQDPSPSYTGRFYTLPPGLQYNPRPVQKPHIPIWIGGVSRPALRRAATRGSGWLGVYQTPEATAEMHATLRDLLRRADRSDAEFTFAHRLRFQVTDADGGDQPCIGSPQKIADSIRRYHDLGVGHLQLAPPPGPTTADLLEQADRFAEQVRPLIADLWPGRTD
ncbi:TIGR03619 family F420-dependent LLM class oxidoreductase [Phytohabitans kaempferiae]|uniref:TIGR03619 family F420-dependent LLM class oxidoreductase n=1 Tax=Phytohabitans kaempferiae TaxID=1620943 RepID=A0ABV6LZ26_9ACTN